MSLRQAHSGVLHAAHSHTCAVIKYYQQGNKLNKCGTYYTLISRIARAGLFQGEPATVKINYIATAIFNELYRQVSVPMTEKCVFFG